MTSSPGYWAGAVAALALIIGLLFLLARLARASGLAPAALLLFEMVRPKT